MARGSKKRRRFRAKTLFQVLLASFSFYLLLCVIGPFYLLFKYSSLDLTQLEPARCKPKVGPLGELEHVNNHLHRNTFGSRNSFEVTPKDKNLVYLLGDSFLFGFDLEDYDTVAHHLNRLDPEHKYVNLAQPGINIVDSAARYRLTRKTLSAPRAVLVQTLMKNDIFASQEMEARIAEETERDHRLLLFPVTLIIDQGWLFRFHYKKYTERVKGDLSKARFEMYMRRPLLEIIRAARRDRAQVMVIEYTSAADYPDYHRELERLCAKQRVSLYKAEQLIGPKERDPLPDGHPGPRMNHAVAKKLSVAFKQLLARAAPSSAPAAPSSAPAAPRPSAGARSVRRLAN
jgi:hypothetical protein